MSQARQRNQEALQTEKDIGLAELDGFQLPSDVTEEFLLRMQESANLLGMTDTMTLQRLEQEVPKFGVPELSGGVRAEEGSRTEASGAESGHVTFDATDQSYYILVEPTRDSMKNTHQGPNAMGNLIVNEFVDRWANDIELIGIRASAASGNLDTYAGRADLDTTFDGWIAIAEGADADSDRIGLEDTAADDVDTMPEYDHTDGAGDPQAVSTELFHNAIQTLDTRYRDPNNVVFLTSPDQIQQYHFDLTGREDALGVPVLQGDNDVTPFSYDVVGIPGWPSAYAMLVDPDNLAYGLYEDMEVDQTTDTDTVHENRLHSRNWLEGQFDFQIKQLQAGVLVTGMADPLA